MGLEVWKRLSSGSASNGMSGVRGSKSSSAGAAKKSSGAAKSTKSVKKRSQVAKQSRATNRDTETDTARERRWRAESDLDALSRASEILESPERVRAAQSIAKEKAKVAQEAAESISKIGKGE